MKTSVESANTSNPTLKTSFVWVFLSILIAGFLFAYLSDALMHCVTTHQQDYYLYWVHTKSLSNWQVYLFVSLLVASFGLLYMYMTREETEIG